jgi:uncharacterized membrane-anchored protein YitT (DUF2179 family)
MSMGVLVLFLLQNTGLYSPGLTAITQGISRLIYVLVKSRMSDGTARLIYNVLFWGLYFLMNVPLFIFGYHKIGKTFSLLTIVFVIFNTATGFALSSIPGIEHLFIFGNTLPGGFDNAANHLPNYLTSNGVFIVPFDLDVDKMQTKYQ